MGRLLEQFKQVSREAMGRAVRLEALSLQEDLRRFRKDPSSVDRRALVADLKDLLEVVNEKAPEEVQTLEFATEALPLVEKITARS